MAKLTLDNLSNLQNENTAVTTINDNSDAIEAAIENTLSRDGTSPNQMESNLDMNGWHISNLPEPSSDTDPVRLIDLTNVSEVTNVLHTTSTTSNTIGTGNKTFTVPSGLGFYTGQYILIQDAASTANYMLGRVVSYSGTSLVFNSEITAGSGTLTNWVIDLSGAPGPVSVLYDTVTNSTAATIPGTQSFLGLAGYSTVGDGGNGLYKRQVSMPSHAGRFQSVDGAWWNLSSNVVTPEMFGCAGDGLTNDQANFQNCIDFVYSRGGGTILLAPNKIYRIVIVDSLTDYGLIVKDNVTIQFNGSKIYLECVGDVYGIRPMNHTKFLGPGTVKLNSSTGITSQQSIFHAVFSIGGAYSDLGTVAAKSPYAEVTDIEIDSLIIDSVTTNALGGMITGYGGVSQIKITNNTFPDNAYVTVPVGFDWNYYGVISSADINLSRANYNAGTAYTLHPHAIRIENNHFGVMSYGGLLGSHGVRTSGCYDVTIRNNTFDSTKLAAVFVTGGDMGWEFAPTNDRYNAMMDYVIEGNNMKNCTIGYGVAFDAYSDNVYQAVFNPANPSYPYSPITDPTGYVINAVIRNNQIQTYGAVSTSPGIYIAFSKGGCISNNNISGVLGNGFLYGVRIASGCKNLKIEQNNIQLNLNAGIYVSESTLPPENTLIRYNYLYRNSGSSATQGNIYINGSTNTRVVENEVGALGEDQASNGIKVDTAAVACSVIDNVIYEVKTGGTAISLPSSTITPVWECRGNRYVNGANTFISGLQIIPYRRDYSTAVAGQIITHAQSNRSSLTTDITPTFGTWGAGSTCINADSVTGQTYLTKCTVSGTPGTWKAVSVVG